MYALYKTDMDDWLSIQDLLFLEACWEATDCVNTKSIVAMNEAKC